MKVIVPDLSNLVSSDLDWDYTSKKITQKKGDFLDST